jgi:glycosyltransferase involved in cell wall biosynthesis
MNKESKQFHLAVIAKHPVHCQLPLYRRLARHPEVQLKMFFGSSFGIQEGHVPVVQKGIQVKEYQAPDLSGVDHTFLRNYGTSSAPTGFWSPINPGILGELRRTRFDAILIHGYGTLMDVIAYIAARLTRTPVFMMGETFLRRDRVGLVKSLRDAYVHTWLKGVRVCLPIGPKSREFYEHYGVPEENLFLAPYSVENDLLQAEAARMKPKTAQLRKKYGLGPKLPVVLFVGRLIARKHPMDLLRAFEAVQTQAQLVIIGDGPELEALKHYAGEKRIENVVFTGFTAPEQTREVFSISDLFVLPSSFEPWGFVINEALCFGLPVLAADGVCAAYDLVRSGENGYIFPARSLDTLEKHLRTMVTDGGLRRRFGTRSLEIISKWTYEVAVERIVRALHTL